MAVTVAVPGFFAVTIPFEMVMILFAGEAFQIIFLLVVLFGYIVAIILMRFSPDIFTMVSFDSGGAVTGPMTTSFLLPFIIGICYASGADVLTQGFGLVALVALSPLITIQILGIIYKIKSSKKFVIDKIDETIIDFERRG